MEIHEYIHNKTHYNMLCTVRNSQGSMRQHRTKSPHFQGVSLFGAFVELNTNSPIFQAVGRFLDFAISQSLIVKLQSKFGVSINFLKKISNKLFQNRTKVTPCHFTNQLIQLPFSFNSFIFVGFIGV